MDPPLFAACVASQMSLNHSRRLLAMIVGTESDDEGLMLSASFVNAAIDNLIAYTVNSGQLSLASLRCRLIKYQLRLG